MTASQIIQLLDLRPHPEGGYYRETYRSPQIILKTSDGRPARPFSTCIYYLLDGKAVSKFHLLQSDEIFHFYAGDPVTWVLLGAGGKTEKPVMGSLSEGHLAQLVIPAGTWFGGYLNVGGDYALMGTTVAPGFDFTDFELADQKKLLAEFPHYETEILKLT